MTPRNLGHLRARRQRLLDNPSLVLPGPTSPALNPVAGASAEVTVGGGFGANVLAGGSNRTVQLQPLSVQQQTGVNVAAGIAAIELQFVR